MLNYTKNYLPLVNMYLPKRSNCHCYLTSLQILQSIQHFALICWWFPITCDALESWFGCDLSASMDVSKLFNCLCKFGIETEAS